MRTFTKISTLQRFLNSKRKENAIIAFVPTMGALHVGHLTLIRKAKEKSDITVCSIFVNPTQFNNTSDLDKYPRQTNKDKQMLKSCHCDVLFLPSVDEVYPNEFESPKVDLGGIELVMEGEKRPGHFEGVVEVVSRLFDIVNPNLAFFGEKDYQQLAIIRRMTSEMSYDIDVEGVEIVRKKSGLAMSSRNQRLSDLSLEHAALIHKTLSKLKNSYKKNTPQEWKMTIKDLFANDDMFKLEYFEIADSKTLRSVKDWGNPNGNSSIYCGLDRRRSTN